MAIVMTFIAQTAITMALGLIAIKVQQRCIGEVFLLPSFLITSGIGSCCLVRECRPLEKLLIAVGYFPMMLIGYWFTALVILQSLPGAQGDL